MILKAKERGDAPQIARYLLADRDNDHVELHELRGFASDDLVSAFEEAGAIASGTRCKNHLFSISLNPPEGEQVGAEAFERAIAQVEQKMGLAGQPRAIVFHEKDGRRHAHAVWSRIGQERMRAINLPHYKIKLRDVSRQLFLDHGWDMPRGLQDRALRDPLNFTRVEWQQARRAGLDSREIKAVLRQCWNASDNRASLGLALKERGFWLARGDRRGFVAVDYRGEVYALARYTSVKTKDIEVRLGNRSALRALSEVKAEIAGNMTERLQSFIKQAERDAKQRIAVVAFRKADMAGRHQADRRELWAAMPSSKCRTNRRPCRAITVTVPKKRRSFSVNSKSAKSCSVTSGRSGRRHNPNSCSCAKTWRSTRHLATSGRRPRHSILGAPLSKPGVKTLASRANFRTGPKRLTARHGGHSRKERRQGCPAHLQGSGACGPRQARSPPA